MRDLTDYQEQYKNQPYERFGVYFRKKKVKEILSKYNHDTLLEIGCGLEPIFRDIDSYKKLYIVEPADLFYNKALDDLKEHPREKDIVVIKKLIEDCDEEFKGVKFNFILLSSLLHEIAQPQKLLKKLHDIALPDTVIHINVSNAKSFHRLLAVEMGLIKSEFEKSGSNNRFQQQAVYDITSLSALVEQNGFRVVESGSYAFKPFTHQQMEDMIQAKLITTEMLEGFYKMEKYIPHLGSEFFINVMKS